MGWLVSTYWTILIGISRNAHGFQKINQSYGQLYGLFYGFWLVILW